MTLLSVLSETLCYVVVLSSLVPMNISRSTKRFAALSCSDALKYYVQSVEYIAVLARPDPLKSLSIFQTFRCMRMHIDGHNCFSECKQVYVRI